MGDTVLPDEQEQKPSLSYRVRSSPSFTLATICLAVFNDVFLFEVIIPVLPYALPERFHVYGEEVQSWISILLSSYNGALLLGALIFGWLGSRLASHRALLLLGLIMLLLATSLLAIPGHVAIVATGRVLQGLSASVVWTSGLTVLTETFGPTNFGEVIGYVMMSVSISNTAAPLLGGIVYSKGGYLAVSLMTLAAVLVDVVMRLLMVDARQGGPGSLAANGRHKDVEDCEGGNGADDRGRTNRAHEPSSETLGEREPLIRKVSPEKAGAHRSAYPMLLRSKRILANLWGIFTWACMMISLETLLPLFVSKVFAWNSTQAGLMFLSWIIPGFLSPLAGKCSDRFGPRWIIVVALLFAIPPLVLLRLVTERILPQEILLCGLLALIGLALTFTITPLMADLVSATFQLKSQHPTEFGDSDALAQVHGLFIFAYSTGALVGPAVVGLLKTHAGWGAATIALACACGFACVPIIAESRRR